MYTNIIRPHGDNESAQYRPKNINFCQLCVLAFDGNVIIH